MTAYAPGHAKDEAPMRSSSEEGEMKVGFLTWRLEEDAAGERLSALPLTPRGAAGVLLRAAAAPVHTEKSLPNLWEAVPWAAASAAWCPYPVGAVPERVSGNCR